MWDTVDPLPHIIELGSLWIYQHSNDDTLDTVRRLSLFPTTITGNRTTEKLKERNWNLSLWSGFFIPWFRLSKSRQIQNRFENRSETVKSFKTSFKAKKFWNFVSKTRKVERKSKDKISVEKRRQKTFSNMQNNQWPKSGIFNNIEKNINYHRALEKTYKTITYNYNYNI